MNFELAALKLMCSQLKQAKQTSTSPSGFTLDGGLLFQRAWLQGVLVSITDKHDNNNSLPRLLLDDGSGIVELQFSNADLTRIPWKIGMYVMVVGSYIARPDQIPKIRIHKMVDLSAFPDREAMWYLEVIEAYRMFYQPLYGEFEE